MRKRRGSAKRRSSHEENVLEWLVAPLEPRMMLAGDVATTESLFAITDVSSDQVTAPVNLDWFTSHEHTHGHHINDGHDHSDWQHDDGCCCELCQGSLQSLHALPQKLRRAPASEIVSCGTGTTCLRRLS